MNEEVAKKTRVTRYCPKVETIKFKLQCEWNKCSYVSNDMDDYMEHIENEHINSKEFDKSNHRSKKSKLDDIASNLKFNSFFLLLDLDCMWCDCEADHTKFDSIETFERHIRYHAFHTKLKFIGNLVIKNFNQTSNLPNVKVNKNVLPINQNFIQECSLDTQSRNLIPELPYKLECSWDNCEYNTDNPELFYRHMKEHVVEVQKITKAKKKLKNKEAFSFKCLWNDCQTIITSQNRLVEHMRHHSQEKQVACHVCGVLFSTFTKYIDHCGRSNANMPAKESEVKSIKFQCSHCNKKFLTNNLLKEHIRKHINKHKCPTCDMTCISKNDLNKHILYKHSNEKRFKCEFCDTYQAKTLNDLNKHILLKHDDAAEEYQCNDCEDFKTKNLNLMKKHMLKYHLNQSKLSYLYKCHECDKSYSNGSTLSSHLKNAHNYKWPSGHSRFRYKLDNDGCYRLQTLRYESVELVEKLNREKEENNKIAQQHQQELEEKALFHNCPVTAAVTNRLSDDRENDFDDENEFEDDNSKEDDETEDEDESFMDTEVEEDDEIEENEIETKTTKSHNSQSYGSFSSTSNFKDYLIKRLIEDENKVNNSNKRQRLASPT